MKENTAETVLGALVLAVALGFFGFAFNQTREAGAVRGASEYFGFFTRADGIAPGTEVRVAGVKVGVVQEVELDRTTYNARVTMAVDPAVQLFDDTFAAVRSDGLLGGAHISLEPSGLEPLPPGGEIIRTQGAQDILSLLFSAISTFSGGEDDPAQGDAP